MNSDIAGTYALFMGYWSNFLRWIYPRTRMSELTEREFEHLVVQPGKTVMPASETEHLRRYNPSEREIQYGIDLVKIILEQSSKKKLISSSQNPAD